MTPDFWDYKNDAPWWYNERALLSLFAGAVWKCKGWAFEEFTTDKRRITKRGNLKAGKGRGDIIFGIGKANFVAEAKQCWPIIGRKSDNSLGNIAKAMKIAQSETSRLPAHGKRLGIVFVTPRLHETNIPYADEILQTFTKGLRKIKNTTLAWSFPAEKRTLNGKDGFRYPGIVLLIKRSVG
jgi:hypothetical protein